MLAPMNPARLLVACLLLLLALAAPAAADIGDGWAKGPEPAPLPAAETPAAAGDVLAAMRPAGARKGLGLPSYRSLLGRRRARRVEAADARFVAALTAPRAKGRAALRAAPDDAGSGVPASIDDDPLNAKDVLKRGAERQKRTMRIEVAVEDTCPRWSEDKTLGGSVHSKVRAEHVVTTVERVRHYDITTIVTFDLEAAGRAGVSSQGILGQPTADWGKVSVVRQQIVRNRRTGKTSRPPLQTQHESIGPLWTLDGGFSDFVDRVNGGDDPTPAPSRPLRARVWDTVAQKFLAAAYHALVAAHKPAADRIATPNACMTLDVPAPERLKPGQVITLHPKPKATHMHAHHEQLMWSGSLGAWLHDGQGASARSVISGAEPAEGAAWFEVTAPPQRWPEDRPFGLQIRLTSPGGVAETTVWFKPVEETPALPYRYRVLDGSFDVHTTASRASGLCADLGGHSGTRKLSGDGAITMGATPPVLEQLRGGALDGEVFFSVPARISSDTTNACKYVDAKKVPCDHDHGVRHRTDTLGFTIRAASVEAEEAVLDWSVPQPEVGFVDAGNEECHTHIWATRDAEDDRQRVPMAKLRARGPQTFEFAGTRTWNADVYGKPAYIVQTWKYSITLERIEG